VVVTAKGRPGTSIIRSDDMKPVGERRYQIAILVL
jgi:hypothetical protein